MTDNPQPGGVAPDLFRLLADNVTDYALFVTDADRRVLTWNTAAERLLGYSEGEILGERADVFFTPEDRAAGRPEEELREALEADRGENNRWHVRKDGSRFWSAGVLTPLRERNGRLHGFCKIMRDQSALKLAEEAQREAEEALRRSEERFRGLMAQAPFSVQIFSADGHSVGVNPAWERLWGVPAEKLDGYNVLEDPQLENAGTLAYLRRAFAGESVFLPEIEYDSDRTVPGESRHTEPKRWVAAVAYPIRDAANIVREVVLVHEDVTARRRAERALRESEEWRRMALEAGRMGTWEWDVQTGRIRWSENLEAIHGLAPGAFDGTYETFRTLIHPDDLPAVESSIEAALRSRTAYETDFRYVRPDGSVGWMAGRGKAYFDGSGRPLRMVGVGMDVTDRKEAERRLVLLSRVLENMAEGVSVSDERGVIVYTNPAEDQIFGYAAGELLGKHVTEQNAYSAEENERKVSEVIERLRSEGVWTGDFLNRRKEGTQFTTACRISALSLDSDTYFVCVQEDVTERRKAERALRESEERFRSVVESGMIGIGFWHGESIIDANEALLSMLGYRRDDLATGRQRWPEITPPEYAEADARAFAETKAVGRCTPYEKEWLRRDGSRLPILIGGAAFDEGRSRGAFFVLDLSARKRAEGSLRFLAEASAALAVLSDPESTFQKVASVAVPAFADWAAVDLLDEAGGRKRAAVSHTDPEKVRLAHELDERYPAQPDDAAGLGKVLRTGKPELMPDIPDSLLEAVAHDREHLRVIRELGLKSYVCVPILSQGRVVGAITFVSAESGRRYGEADLRTAEDLARRAAVVIENARLYAEVKEADRRKDQFLAMLAHELRNPLAPITSGLDLLKMSGSEPEVVDLMSGQIEHLVRLVDDLLDVSRIVRGRVELRRQPIDLAEVVQRAVESVRAMFVSQKQELFVALPDGPVPLEADAVRLSQVLTNLLTNASKYTEAGGKASLSAGRTEGEVVISVSDTGIGIDRDLLPHVFELFTQSTRTIDRSQGGLGIGLTVVKSLVEMHGGTVAASSEGPGRGSTFTVRLPTSEASSEPAKPAPTTDTSAFSRRVLIVDDNVPAAKLLVRLLGKLGGHEVVTAHDGEAALIAAEAYRPDLILLDIGLPKLDGYAVARRLRARPEFDRTLLVALTGYGTEEDRRRSANAGFDEHVTKPPSLDMLRRVLARPRPPEIAESGGWGSSSCSG